MCFLKASKWMKNRTSSYFLCREISERQTWRQESWSRISNTCLSLPFRKSGGRKRKRKSFVPKTANSRWRQNVVLPRACLQDKTASSKPSWKMYSEKNLLRGRFVLNSDLYLYEGLHSFSDSLLWPRQHVFDPIKQQCTKKKKNPDSRHFRETEIFPQISLSLKQENELAIRAGKNGNPVK